ncbi:MAG: hypothetical protein ABSH05_25435 [Bryobacteraceae bacterium]
MADILHRNRRAVSIEDDAVRLTVLVEGGHVAEILDKETGVNPLWTPPWLSIEPSAYSRERNPEYGDGAESKLLAGIMGHNLCMDIFGGVSEEEAAAGLTVHGEASVVPYEIEARGVELAARTVLPNAQLRIERRLRLPGAGVVRFSETVENLTAADRPIGWTQHVTLGPPFLEKGRTEFRAPSARSEPLESGGAGDFHLFTKAAVSGGFTTHLMDPARERAFFAAFSPALQVLFGYVWKRSDFPWLGVWEENYVRTQPPWSGRTLTRGMEFGVSPVPEPRRRMIERNGMFGVPGFRWISARSRVRVDYCAFIRRAGSIADEVLWDGGNAVTTTATPRDPHSRPIE